jgi:hypothetical protein
MVERFARLMIFFTSCHLDNMAGAGLGTVTKRGKLFEAHLRSGGEMEASFVRHSTKWYLVRTDSGFKYGYIYFCFMYVLC